MRTTHRKPTELILDQGDRFVLIPLLLLAVGVPWSIWNFVSIQHTGGSQSSTFDAEAGCFAILAIGYLGLHGLRGMAWSSVTMLFTIEALIGLFAIPVWRFAQGYDRVDTTYVHAMLLVLIGFTAFWIGSLALKKETGWRFVPRLGYTPGRVEFMSTALLGLGVAGNVALWKAGLFAFTQDTESRTDSLGFVHWLAFLGGLLGMSLVVSAIEVFGKRSSTLLIRLVFWFAFLFSMVFGVISGDKKGMLFPLVYVVLIYGFTRNRMPRAALLFPVILVTIVYPFVNAYRYNLERGFRSQVNTLGGLEATLGQSFDDAFRSFGATGEETRKANSQLATARLSHLTYIHDVVGLPAPSMLNGDEKVWMAPIYPLVPRFLWKSKPVLDKGVRLSIILGRGNETSSAPTLIGDLYAMYGTYGVMLGMLVLGVCLQLYMNWMRQTDMSERELFIYASLLFTLIDFEDYVVGYVANAVQTAIVLVVMSYIIYGRSTSTLPERRPAF